MKDVLHFFFRGKKRGERNLSEIHEAESENHILSTSKVSVSQANWIESQKKPTPKETSLRRN